MKNKILSSFGFFLIVLSSCNKQTQESIKINGVWKTEKVFQEDTLVTNPTGVDFVEYYKALSFEHSPNSDRHGKIKMKYYKTINGNVEDWSGELEYIIDSPGNMYFDPLCRMCDGMYGYYVSLYDFTYDFIDVNTLRLSHVNNNIYYILIRE